MPITISSLNQFHSLGLNLIPIDRLRGNGKCPPKGFLWKQFQNRTVPLDTYQRSSDSWAILVGKFHGLVVVDSDSPEAEAWAQTNLPSSPWTVRTRKGFHRYYKWPTGVKDLPTRLQICIDGTKLNLDIKASGYVLAPGSIHPSGHVYDPMRDWQASDELPEFDPKWIPEAPCRERPEVAESSVSWERLPQSLQNRVIGLLQSPWVKPAIQGNQGNRQSLRVACDVARKLGRYSSPSSIRTALELSGWNEKCSPPWRGEQFVGMCQAAHQMAGGEQ